MAITIYYTGTDQGDGSLGVEFWESQECIDLLEEYDFEYHRGESGGSFTVDGTITGIHIQTMEDAKQYLEDMGLLEDEENDD